jgi:enoyl-CoA hydratase
VLGHSVLDKLDQLPMPSIALINGYAFGGGLELALACTFRLAAPSAKLGFPEIKLGLIPGYGGTQRLPRLVGEARATELILTGRTVDAAEAERMGLVNRVVATGEGLAAAQQLAAQLAAFPQTCLREDRLSLLEQEGLAEEQAMAGELAHGRRSLADVQAGLDRFRGGAGRHGEFDH